ncbi:putative secreted protein [Streptomyces viridochromogenes Tue57]|uniref:Putative secreted protein n=1 Tax=Streptomyces viridochromogenes Tue57 TaxID=1160705 RepID=L8PFM4_STRVR|nr:putative secreted protein [Streptomyces viridochromogenes Tue57]
MVLAALITCAGVFGGKLDDRFTVPGTESQPRWARFGRTLPAAQPPGAGAQLRFTAPQGHRATDAPYPAATPDPRRWSRRRPRSKPS